MIDRDAGKYHIDREIVENVLHCESRMDPNAEGDVSTSTAIATTSWGIAQIHLPSHPDITKEQAFDASFSIEFLAKEISHGNGHLWTCYRNLGYL